MHEADNDMREVVWLNYDQINTFLKMNSLKMNQINFYLHNLFISVIYKSIKQQISIYNDVWGDLYIYIYMYNI